MPGIPEVEGYRLVEQIGEGGTGVVFLALSTGPVRREVALKVLKVGRRCADGLARFAVEREALARMDHPNIARVFDGGEDKLGCPFYAMELVDGVPISDFCKLRALSAESRLRLIQTVCSAIQHAHQLGVLHGDIKPSNILVAQDELGQPQPKLIDFGIAWRTSGGAVGGMVTPGYGSPEQLLGGRLPDARSDIYSLGIVLREVIAASQGWHGLEARWIVERATRENPAERYESAGQMAADLGRLLEGRPLEAGPDTHFYRLSRWARRHRWRLLTAALAGSLFLFAAGMGAWQAIRVRNAGQQLRVARARAEAESRRAQLTETLVHGLAMALRDDDPRRRTERVEGLLEGVAQGAARAEESGELETAFSIRMAIGVAARAAGSLPRAEASFLAATHVAARMSDLGTQRGIGAAGALARVQIECGKYSEAEVGLRKLVASVGPEAGVRAQLDPRLDLARLCLMSGRAMDADAYSSEALTLARGQLDAGHPGVLQALHLRGRVLLELGRLPEAGACLSEAVQGYTKHFGAGAPETHAARQDLRRWEDLESGGSGRTKSGAGEL